MCDCRWSSSCSRVLSCLRRSASAGSRSSISCCRTSSRRTCSADVALNCAIRAASSDSRWASSLASRRSSTSVVCLVSWQEPANSCNCFSRPAWACRWASSAACWVVISCCRSASHSRAPRTWLSIAAWRKLSSASRWSTLACCRRKWAESCDACVRTCSIIWAACMISDGPAFAWAATGSANACATAARSAVRAVRYSCVGHPFAQQMGRIDPRRGHRFGDRRFVRAGFDLAGGPSLPLWLCHRNRVPALVEGEKPRSTAGRRQTRPNRQSRSNFYHRHLPAQK